MEMITQGSQGPLTLLGAATVDWGINFNHSQEDTQMLSVATTSSVCVSVLEYRNET